MTTTTVGFKIAVANGEVFSNVETRIREHIEDAKAELNLLLDREQQIRDNLNQYQIAIAPHLKKLLVDIGIRHIFHLISDDYAAVDLPYSRERIPPQVFLSHVCSAWRPGRIALSKGSLWSRINIRRYAEESRAMWEAWLSRVGTHPITIPYTGLICSSIGLTSISLLNELFAPFQFKEIIFHIMSSKQLSTLCELSDDALATLQIENVGLEFAGPYSMKRALAA